MKRLVFIAAVTVWLAPLSQANAYPHFQLTSGTDTCKLCHYAPAGGGMLTSWGREESADTLSTWGGNGDFLHGVPLPEWLDMGGDVRVAALANDVGASEGTETAIFPMQADFAARVRFTKQWSFIGNLGLRGSVRQPDLQDGTEREEASALSYLISREHYLYWTKPSGPYARAGRYYAPFGLRLPDHTSFVRRYTGFNLLEETYGISAGYVKGKKEYHATMHVSDELRWAPRREVGGTAMAEWRLGSSVLGASTRVGVASADMRATAGAFGKHWLESAKILLMAEVDMVWQRLSDADESRFQLASYLGPVWFPTQGLSVSAAYEFYDQDLIVKAVEKHAASFWLSFLPRSHFEVMLSGRAQLVGDSNRAYVGLLQLHYYL